MSYYSCAWTGNILHEPHKYYLNHIRIWLSYKGLRKHYILLSSYEKLWYSKSDITWVLWHLISLATDLFVQKHIHANNKETTY